MDFEADMVHQKMKLILFKANCSTRGCVWVWECVSEGWELCEYVWGTVYKDLSSLKQPPPAAAALGVKIISRTAELGNWMFVSTAVDTDAHNQRCGKIQERSWSIVGITDLESVEEIHYFIYFTYTPLQSGNHHAHTDTHTLVFLKLWLLSLT